MERSRIQPLLITTLFLAFVLKADSFPAHAQPPPKILSVLLSRKPPLIAAVEHGSAAEVAAILKTNPPVDIHDPNDLGTSTPLLRAIYDDALYNYYFYGAAPEAQRKRAHHSTTSDKAFLVSFEKHCQALRQQDELIVRLLLDHGADVNQQDSSGVTPLMVSASAGNVADVQALLAHGADLNHRAEGGIPVLTFAVAGINIPPFFHPFISDRATLHYRYHETVSFFLSHGADINAQDNQGRTALMMATDNKDIAPIRWLLAAGDDPRIKDKKGKTALDYARNHKNLAAVRLLKQAMHSAISPAKTAGNAINHGG